VESFAVIFLFNRDVAVFVVYQYFTSRDGRDHDILWRSFALIFSVCGFMSRC